MDRLQQLDLFAPAIAAAGQYDVAVTPEVSEWLAAGAVCALGLSGGKDSQAMAIRVDEYLDDEVDRRDREQCAFGENDDRQYHQQRVLHRGTPHKTIDLHLSL